MSSPDHNEPSKLSAIKDQALGTVKHAIGNVLGNNKLEVEGKAQKDHGKTEYEHAKAAKNKDSEPVVPATQPGYDPQTYNQQSYPTSEAHTAQGAAPPAPTQPLPPTPVHEQSVPQVVPPPPTSGQTAPPPPPQPTQGYDPQTYQQQIYPTQGTVPPVSAQPVPPAPAQPVPPPPAQPPHDSGLTAPQAVATEKSTAELEGKAHELHAKNEAEFAKAQKDGLDEPEHYAQGTKTTRHAEGEVEDQSVSTLGALKDKAIGSVKEMLGSATGNQDMELKGKAQNIHGRNQAEFVKAEKEGLSEPAHFSSGTKTTDHADGKVEGDNVSTLSALKDQVVGSAKQTLGTATGNTNTELEGKAQLVHGRNEAEFAKAQKDGLSEPEHFANASDPNTINA